MFVLPFRFHSFLCCLNGFIVSVSCCAAAKETNESHFHLTAKELSELIKDFTNAQEELEFDKPFNESTGAAAICGTSGGVTESVMRTLTKAENQLEYNSLRNFEDIVRISKIADMLVCVTTTDSVGYEILQRIIKKEKIPPGIRYFEPSSCPGGCLNGGGTVAIQDATELKTRYTNVYTYDRQNEKRCSHLNETLKGLYQKLFDDEKPGNPEAIELFHNSFSENDFAGCL